VEPAQRRLIQRRDQVYGRDLSHPYLPSYRLASGIAAVSAAEATQARRRSADLEVNSK
jgi:hypothetical protein